ncbi:hypothetical protein CDD82_6142 [Ophiocordyceps australis]|uniref:Uncharacterized protein n=1 Tax=Ophiocordyceps australis TaxID=1399860 RepID=A0A2C5YYP2_9HYPO|nr:hypothetical protein CDD82_6142 [Ophiocordyceps australis]
MAPLATRARELAKATHHDNANGQPVPLPTPCPHMLHRRDKRRQVEAAIPHPPSLSRPTPTAPRPDVSGIHDFYPGKATAAGGASKTSRHRLPRITAQPVYLRPPVVGCEWHDPRRRQRDPLAGRVALAADGKKKLIHSSGPLSEPPSR